MEFATRTKSFILCSQFDILISQYVSRFEEVVRFANKHCSIFFEPEIKNIQDIIPPILVILDNQITFADRKILNANIKPFLNAVITNDNFLPKVIKELTE
jgi:hypothetical protein